MWKQTAGVLLVTVTVGATCLSWAAPAGADLTTRCVGQGGAVTVPGDLVVPRDSSCTLSGTTVTGDVRVGAGGDLVAEGVTVEGRLTAAPGAYVDVTGSSVGGRVVLRGAYGAYFDTSDFGDRVVTRPGDEAERGGFVYTFEADIAGDLVSRQGELFVESSEVGGTVNSRRSLYTDVYDSFIDGRLVVRENESGSVVCGTAIQGVSRFVDNNDLLQLGSDGPYAGCETGSYWGGNVTVRGTTAGRVYVDNGIVNGNLTLRGNDPVARVGPETMVRGEIRGEYEDWQPPSVRAHSVVPRGTPTRTDALDAKVDKRHDAAVESAERTGPAHLDDYSSPLG